MSSRMLTAVLVAAIVAAACVPAEDERVTRFARDTPLGRIQARGALRVGLQPSPPFAFVPKGNDPKGFAVEIARFVAQDLGVGTEFVVAKGAEELLLMVERQTVDIAFPLVPITEELVKGGFRTVSDPYFIGHQRLLVPSKSPVRDVSDLQDKAVCAILDPDAGVVPHGVELVRPASPGACARLLDRGEVRAATASDDVLMHIRVLLEPGGTLPPSDARFRIVGEQLSTAGFGAVLPKTRPTYTSFVNDTLEEATSDGRWLEAYERWIGPYLGEPGTPPELSMGEAAALFPSR